MHLLSELSLADPGGGRKKLYKNDIIPLTEILCMYVYMTGKIGEKDRVRFLASDLSGRS